MTPQTLIVWLNIQQMISLSPDFAVTSHVQSLWHINSQRSPTKKLTEMDKVSQHCLGLFSFFLFNISLSLFLPTSCSYSSSPPHDLETHVQYQPFHMHNANKPLSNNLQCLHECLLMLFRPFSHFEVLD